MCLSPERATSLIRFFPMRHVSSLAKTHRFNYAFLIIWWAFFLIHPRTMSPSARVLGFHVLLPR